MANLELKSQLERYRKDHCLNLSYLSRQIGVTEGVLKRLQNNLDIRPLSEAKIRLFLEKNFKIS